MLFLLVKNFLFCISSKIIYAIQRVIQGRRRLCLINWINGYALYILPRNHSIKRSLVVGFVRLIREFICLLMKLVRIVQQLMLHRKEVNFNYADINL